MSAIGHPRDVHAGGRLLRLAPTVVAAYELRYLITHLARLISGAGAHHVSGRLAPLALILIAAVAVLLLRESGRGLSSRIGSPTCSVALLRAWLLCTVGLGVVLLGVLAFSTVTTGGHGAALAHTIGFGDWFAAGPALLLAGLLLALSLHGARWLLARVRSAPPLDRRAGEVVVVNVRASDFRIAGAPLRAGWSDRGPPRAAPATN